MWSHTESGRLIRTSPSPPIDMADIEIDNFSEYGDNQVLQNLHEQLKTLRDFSYLTRKGHYHA